MEGELHGSGIVQQDDSVFSVGPSAAKHQKSDSYSTYDQQDESFLSSRSFAVNLSDC